jgi:hypothetical protein
MPFQTQVNITPAPAVEGDFASADPRFAVLAGPGQLVAGPNGMIVGRFAWLDGTYTLASSSGSGAPAGFAARMGNSNAIITAFLAETTMTVPKGMGVTLYREGDFWVRNSGTGEVVPNMKAYANNATGLVTFAATGTPPQDWSMTGSIAAGAGSVTGSIADNLMTVTVVGSGTIQIGGTITGSGVATGTVVTSQVSGTANGVGVYTVTPPGQTVASTTLTEAHGILTISAATTGTVHVGDSIVAGGGGGTNSVAGTTVTALGTGTGGTGTYIVNNNTVVTSGTLVGNAGTETKWLSASFAAAGELVKMTSWPQG